MTDDEECPACGSREFVSRLDGTRRCAYLFSHGSQPPRPQTNLTEIVAYFRGTCLCGWTSDNRWRDKHSATSDLYRHIHEDHQEGVAIERVKRTVTEELVVTEATA